MKTLNTQEMPFPLKQSLMESKETLCILSASEVKTLAAVQEFVKDYLKFIQELDSEKEVENVPDIRDLILDCQDRFINRIIHINT